MSHSLHRQVEDFIDTTSTIPLSSVPVQFLIYVAEVPSCNTLPTIIPLQGCFEVQVGMTINFDIYAMNTCNRTISEITDIQVTPIISGMTVGNLTDSLTNSSLVYITITWTPQINQIGPQQFCFIAYTE